MLNIDNFDIKLDTEFIGRNFIIFDEVDSTNEFLLNKSNKINENGAVVFAEKQNAGRGRFNRSWISAREQNLTFSILITDKKLLGERVTLINFAASLSIALSIENLYQLKTNLKWPNDILINGKKISGILIESSSKGNKINRMAVGIGLNVNQGFFNGSFNIPPTSIRIELEQNVERETLLAEVLNNFEEILLKIHDDPSYILRDWKSRCGMIGEKVAVIEGDKTRYGIFDDIDDNGFLLLKVKDKIETIHFGDVSIK
jgi:BirA family transcriptional regulator, biotin operon repressor / biotin---[acetyl-CoA-carboxylase] ligase